MLRAGQALLELHDVGERLTFVALTGLLLDHTGRFAQAGQSSLLLWLLGMAQLLPVLLFSPFTGAWVDRCNLKRVMVASDAVRALLVVLIPVSYLATRSVWPVNLLVFALFTCNVFFLPAKSAITPEIVPGRQLLLANALLAGAGIVGTAFVVVGGWIVDHWGWGPALYINGVTYLVSVFSLLLIRYRPAARADARTPVSVCGYLHEVAEGWRLVRTTPVLVLALIALGAIWAGGGVAHVTATQHIALAAGAEVRLEFPVVESTATYTVGWTGIQVPGWTEVTRLLDQDKRLLSTLRRNYEREFINDQLQGNRESLALHLGQQLLAVHAQAPGIVEHEEQIGQGPENGALMCLVGIAQTLVEFAHFIRGEAQGPFQEVMGLVLLLVGRVDPGQQGAPGIQVRWPGLRKIQLA